MFKGIKNFFTPPEENNNLAEKDQEKKVLDANNLENSLVAVWEEATFSDEEGAEQAYFENILSEYHDEEGYEDYFDSPGHGLDLEELMSKYDLDEIDVMILGAKAYTCLRDGRKNPFPGDINKTKEFATYYQYRLEADNSFDLPFTKEELSRLSESEAYSLKKLYGERGSLINAIWKKQNEHRTKHDKAFRAEDQVVYSIQSSDDQKYDSLSLKKLQELLYQWENNISGLERKALTDPELVRQEQIKAQAQRLAAQEEREWQKGLKERPTYSEEDKAFHEDCLNYLSRHGRNSKMERPSLVGDVPASDKQILEGAQEAAYRKVDEGKMMIKSFFIEEHKGRRQLSSVVTEGGKRWKYVFSNPVLPAGRYAFEVDLEKMFQVSPNSAIVPIKIMVNLGNIDKVSQAIDDNLNELRRKRNLDKDDKKKDDERPEDDQKDDDKPKKK